MMGLDSPLTRLNWFKEHKLKQGFTDIEALEALQLYAQRREPIPDELYPFLEQVCEYWKNNHKGKYSKKSTADRNASIAWDVALLIKQGVLKENSASSHTKKDAFDLVAERYCVSRSTVRAAYDGTTNTEAKEEVKLVFGSGKYKHQDPDKDEL